MRIEKKQISELSKASYNPRVMGDKERGALGSSIEKFGLVEPLVWNERTGNLVGGHQRLEQLRSSGETEVDVVVVDMDEQEEVALNITLNNPHIEGDWSEELAGVLNEVPEDWRDELNFDLLGAFAELGEVKPPESKGEIKMDDLMGDCDASCPCCGFAWQSDDKDYFEVN